MEVDEPERERNPFLEAVGRVTLAGGLLDSSLRSLLSTLALEPTLLAQANAEGTARLIERCKLALRVHRIPAADAEAITICLNRARALKDKRNRVVHAVFFPDEDGVGLQAFMPLKKMHGMSGSSITIDQMEETASQIEELRMEIFRTGWNATADQSGMSRF
jgi:hypothetical protein